MAGGLTCAAPTSHAVERQEEGEAGAQLPQEGLLVALDELAPEADVRGTVDDAEPDWLREAGEAVAFDGPLDAEHEHVYGQGSHIGHHNAHGRHDEHDSDLDGDLDEGDGDWLDDRDEVQREEDRKAGLQHYLRLGQWQEAEKLVATEDEYDDLQYLKARELREHQGGI